jgi:hypothetical protein
MRTNEEHLVLSSIRKIVMSEAHSLTLSDRYEQSCDRAIAMCNGNLRSTIKALIIAKEYLEAELRDLRARPELQRAENDV